MIAEELRAILAELKIDVLQRRHNGWWIAHCPFAPYLHRSGRDRSPSFGVKVEPNGVSAFSCYTCHKHGRVSGLCRLLEELRGKNYKLLAIRADIADSSGFLAGAYDADREREEDNPQPLNEAAYGDIYPRLDESFPEAYAYVRARGVTDETIAITDLRYDQDHAQRRILFPVRDDRNLLYGYTGRAIDAGVEPKVRDYFGLPKRSLLLGAQFYRKGFPVLVVEGLFGWANMINAGVLEVCTPVALMGNSVTQQKMEILCRWNERTFLLLDDDFGGDVGLWGPVDSAGNHQGGGAVDMLFDHVPVYLPVLPSGVEDVDYLTLNHVQDMLTVDPVLTRTG